MRHADSCRGRCSTSGAGSVDQRPAGTTSARAASIRLPATFRPGREPIRCRGPARLRQLDLAGARPGLGAGPGLPVAVGHVERVDDRARDRGHPGRADVQPGPFQRGGDPAQQADLVLAAELDDGRVGRRRRTSARTGGGAAARPVRGASRRAPSRPASSASPSSPFSARARSLRTSAGSGIRPNRGSTTKRLTAMPAWVRIDASRTSSECSASTPARAVQRARGVRRGDDTSSSSDDDRQLARLGQLAPLVVQRRDGRVPAADHRRAGPADQVGDQPGLPVAPRRRARWPWRRRRSARAAGRAARPSPPTASRTISIVIGSSRSRRVAVSGSSRWCRTSATTIARSSPAKPIRARDRRGVLGADDRVVPAGIALADVVQQRADEQQVAAGRRRRRRAAAAGGGLQQVPVDGEAVDRVVLGPAAHRVPLRDQPDQQPGLVERLEHRDRRAPGAEHGEEVLARVARPRRRAAAPTPRRAAPA